MTRCQNPDNHFALYILLKSHLLISSHNVNLRLIKTQFAVSLSSLFSCSRTSFLDDVLHLSVYDLLFVLLSLSFSKKHPPAVMSMQRFAANKGKPAYSCRTLHNKEELSICLKLGASDLYPCSNNDHTTSLTLIS
jgi:hypothetical protein